MPLSHYNRPGQEGEIIDALKAEIAVERGRVTTANTNINTATTNIGLKAAKAQPAFTNATPLKNGWLEGLSAPGYFKDEFDIVHLRGAIKSGTTSAAAFVLPPGYRPSVICIFPVIDGANIVAPCSVDTYGNVIIWTTTSNANGFNLAPVQFKV